MSVFQNMHAVPFGGEALDAVVLELVLTEADLTSPLGLSFVVGPVNLSFLVSVVESIIVIFKFNRASIFLDAHDDVAFAHHFVNFGTSAGHSLSIFF